MQGASSLKREPRVENEKRKSSFGFVEPEDAFADDELMTTNLEEEVEEAIAGTTNYLERDNFANELGDPSIDPFAEDFFSVAKHEIVDVVGDDRAGRPIIVVYAYRLPSNKEFDHQKFLRYLINTLDQFVDQDYTIVYFHHGLRSHNKPPLSWLLQAYKILDRKYKKNLKALYLVHPTRFIRFLWTVFKPLISAKFEQKLHYVNCLRDLNELLHTDQLGLPTEIREHDEELIRAQQRRGFSSGASVSVTPLPTQQFGVSLQFVLSHHPGCKLPPAVEDILAYLRTDGLDTEGIFRRSASITHVKETQRRINNGETVNWYEVADVHLAAVLLKAFLRELQQPLIVYELYPQLLQLQAVSKEERSTAVKSLVKQLPQENYVLLKALIEFLTEVMSHSDRNKMTASSLAIVFGPNLAWPKEQQVSLSHLQHLNNFCHRLITDYAIIFDDNSPR